ncbi:MAG: hypothetical protein V4732_12235 [Pseudomonadota bacterium]
MKANKVKVIRKGDGRAFKSKNGEYVFVKSGIHFAISIEQMHQMSELFTGLIDGSLEKIDPSSPEMAFGE